MAAVGPAWAVLDALCASGYDPRAPLVGLDLLEDRFDLPALGVERGEFGCRDRVGPQHAGHQPVGGAGGSRPAVVLQGVLHHPDLQYLGAGMLVGPDPQLGAERPSGKRYSTVAPPSHAPATTGCAAHAARSPR